MSVWRDGDQQPVPPPDNYTGPPPSGQYPPLPPNSNLINAGSGPAGSAFNVSLDDFASGWNMHYSVAFPDGTQPYGTTPGQACNIVVSNQQAPQTGTCVIPPQAMPGRYYLYLSVSPCAPAGWPCYSWGTAHKYYYDVTAP